MISREMILTQQAANFTARFGFITRELFFEYFCQINKTQQYFYWRQLLKNGAFVASQSDNNIYYLTQQGRLLADVEAVTARKSYFISHDEFVAKIYLNALATGLVVQAWTEAELKASASTTYSVLGVDRIEKIPDLVIDFKGQSKVLRCAFEVENTRKIAERYDRMAFNYYSMKKIHLILFGCSNEGIVNSVKRSFSGALFQKNQKVPITFLNENFKNDGYETIASLNSKKMRLREMLIAALQIENDAWPTHPEKTVTQKQNFPEKSKCENNQIPKEDQDITPARPSTGPLASFRDHPHPTMLIEGGHEPGAGVGRGPESTEGGGIL